MRAILAMLATAVAASALTLGVVQATSHNPQPVCVVIHANGAPAPASCADPNSYQVTP
jgi:hypothetical protein